MKLKKQLENYQFAIRKGKDADLYLLNQSAALTTFVDQVLACMNELMEKIEKQK